MESDYRRVLALGIILLCCAFALFVYMTTAATASGKFDPPSEKQAQRIIGRAYDTKLRARYPRSGITTRCRGIRRLVCSVHVRRRGVEMYWQITRVNLERGTVHTVLGSDLGGVIAIPDKQVMYRSRPLEAK